MNIATILPNELAQLGADAEIIDVRNPNEFQNVHAKGAVNHPLDQLDPPAIMQARNGAADKPLYLICQMGMRSHHACQQFVASGFPNVVNVEGGTALWEQQGLPVIRPLADAALARGEAPPKPGMAMDRQVRIAAGLLTILGVLLAAVMQPTWIGLLIAGVIGAGLTFSGVTNTCGMASALALMPWNRVKSKPC